MHRRFFIFLLRVTISFRFYTTIASLSSGTFSHFFFYANHSHRHFVLYRRTRFASSVLFSKQILPLRLPLRYLKVRAGYRLRPACYQQWH